MVNRVIIGIDPGVNGAIAVIADGVPFRCRDMPVINRHNGGQMIDALTLNVYFRELMIALAGAHVHAVLEPPSTRRGESPTNALKMGEGYGILRGVLTCHGIGFTEARPQVWKAYYGLVKVGEFKPTKEDSRQRAMMLWPGCATWFVRKCDHDRAEAMLMAKWGLETECWLPKSVIATAKKRTKPKTKRTQGELL